MSEIALQLDKDEQALLGGGDAGREAAMAMGSELKNG